MELFRKRYGSVDVLTVQERYGLKAIKIGDVTSEQGKKVSGHLKIADKASSSIDIPVTITQGRNEGPTLVVLAGEHGCEYCGIVAAIQIIRDTGPDEINGTLVVVPLANPPAFDERALFVNPIDLVNLYASYPGTMSGTVSHIMAYRIFNEIALKADFLIHLHGADYNEALVPFNYYAVTGNDKVDLFSRKLAQCFPVDYVLEARMVKETGEGSPRGTTYAAAATGTLYGEVSSKGIPATMCEAGREGKVEPQFVDVHMKGIKNAMRLIGMSEGQPELRENQLKLHDQVLVSNKSSGIFVPFADVGQNVKEGQIIGHIINFRGEVVEKIQSPISGMIVDRINFAAADGFPTQKQPYLFYIAKTLEV